MYKNVYPLDFALLEGCILIVGTSVTSITSLKVTSHLLSLRYRDMAIRRAFVVSMTKSSFEGRMATTVLKISLCVQRQYLVTVDWITGLDYWTTFCSKITSVNFYVFHIKWSCRLPHHMVYTDCVASMLFSNFDHYHTHQTLQS